VPPLLRFAILLALASLVTGPADQASEFGQLVGLQIGDGPEVQTCFRPMSQVIAALRKHLHAALGTFDGRPHEQIDDMLPMTLDEGGGGTAVEKIDPAAGQREALILEIRHGRREIGPALEPRFEGVLVGRCDVEQMIRQQRPGMVGRDFLRQAVVR
jgi:hypothetical protein